MSQTLPRTDGPGDAELISAVRGGDIDSYGELFARHVDSARALARQLVAGGDADDLVSDAFAKVLTVLQRGGGPDVAFRAYLLTAVRRLHIDKIRASSRLQTTDDMEKFDPGTPFRDTAIEGFENAAAAAAFASLPERWQLVLWHTEVEGQKPADIAHLLGMSPNSVSALAYRAREGLRQAYLNSHVQDLENEDCRWTHSHLGGYVRNGVSRRDAAKVEAHLDECRTCMAIYLELTEVNSNLAGILGPMVLGSAAAGYLASMGGAAPVGLVALLGNLRAQVNPVVASGVAVAVAVAGVAGAVALKKGNGDPSPDAGGQPTAPISSAPAADPVEEPPPTPATESKPKPEPTETATDLPVAVPPPDDDLSSAPTSGPRTDPPGDTPQSPKPTEARPDPTDAPSTPVAVPDPAFAYFYREPAADEPHKILITVTDAEGGELVVDLDDNGPPLDLTLPMGCVPDGTNGGRCTVTDDEVTMTIAVAPFRGPDRDLTLTLVHDGAADLTSSPPIRLKSSGPDVPLSLRAPVAPRR
ncbi:MAG: sigma-70 family RNA polymerase sigma factor [Nocardioides sp.]